VLAPDEIELAKIERQRRDGISVAPDVFALLQKHAANASV
jgi:LDH2 family malate/lactate/ureidoglycolate dehydrogenase